MKNYFFVIILLTLVFSCTKRDKLLVDVSNINAKVAITRFEKVFYEADSSKLQNIKKEFRYFFPHDVDSIWVKKMQDKDEQELFKATMEAYPNLTIQKEQIRTLFKHVKYYYPKFKEPKIVTLNSNVSFNQKVVYVDSLLLVSLDVFLGKDSEIYQDYPAYIKESFTKEQLIVAIGEELVNPIVFHSKDRTFLSRIIQKGKTLYALDAFLPSIADYEKISYTKEEYQWVTNNENMIWKYFIENKLLYSTDIDLNQRFIDEAPFSKFYLDIDNDSPGRVGAWLGWQIVRSFMHHNEVTLSEMMLLENEQIFKKSKYKPKK